MVGSSPFFPRIHPCLLQRSLGRRIRSIRRPHTQCGTTQHPQLPARQAHRHRQPWPSMQFCVPSGRFPPADEHGSVAACIAWRKPAYGMRWAVEPSDEGAGGFCITVPCIHASIHPSIRRACCLAALSASPINSQRGVREVLLRLPPFVVGSTPSPSLQIAKRLTASLISMRGGPEHPLGFSIGLLREVWPREAHTLCGESSHEHGVYRDGGRHRGEREKKSPHSSSLPRGARAPSRPMVGQFTCRMTMMLDEKSRASPTEPSTS